MESMDCSPSSSTVSSVTNNDSDDDFVNCRVHPSVDTKSPTRSPLSSFRAKSYSNTENVRPLSNSDTIINSTPRLTKSKPAIVKKKNQQDRAIRVGEKGKIHYFDDEKLGEGATSTVYKGYYEDETRPAAVKKLYRKSIQIFEIELKALRTVDRHDNIVRYFSNEKFNSHFYIAMELGNCTLEQCVNNKADDFVDTPLKVIKKYCLDACRGLDWMHRKKFLHRDIKPTNIVIFHYEESAVAKLVDFGVSRTLSSMTDGTDSQGRGTADWMSPEGLEANSENREFKTTRGVDVFSLGATIFYALSGGIHPFGNSIVTRYLNIIQNPPNWLHIKDDVSLINLLTPMLAKNPKHRPSMGCVLEHSYYWDGKKELDFIVAVSNALNISSKKNEGQSSIASIRNKVDSLNPSLCIDNWKDKLCPHVKSLLNFKKNYEGDSIMKLIEFIRDKWQHSAEWPNVLKDDEVFGQSEETYMKYFTDRFPSLITGLYTTLQRSKHEKLTSLKSKFFQINVNAAFPLVKAVN